MRNDANDAICQRLSLHELLNLEVGYCKALLLLAKFLIKKDFYISD